MKFKTIYVDLVTNKELHLKQNSCDEGFFMPIDRVNRLFSEIRGISDHLSFSLFHDVNDHPQISDIFKLTFDYGFRYDVTFLSNAFINNLSLYQNNNSIAHIRICIESLEKTHSLNTALKAKQLHDAILNLEKFGHHLFIELPTRDTMHYQDDTLTFMNELGFDLEQETWENGLQLNLTDNITIRCCDKLKEPINDTLPKKVLGRCHGAVTMLGIMSDGSVIPCNYLRGKKIILGNIFETPMVEILNSTPFVSISDGFYKNQLVHSVCQHCPRPRKIF